MTTPVPTQSRSGRTGGFAATRWTMVLAAGQRDGSEARRALEELVRCYWPPLYAYARRRGRTVEQAEDLTQAFFARLLEKQDLASVNRSKGRFRSFLLASLKHFMANQWDRARAQKRGGGRVVSFDVLNAEAQYAVEPVDTLTPERLYERRWALTVLDQVLARLQQDYATRGQRQLFDALKNLLTGDSDVPTHAELGQQLDMSPGAIKVAAHRLRQRYRQLLRDEIAQTVASPGLIDEEIAYLLRCL